MQGNSLYEVPFRIWALRQVATQWAYYRTAATNERAEIVGCSLTTTAWYVAKLTSRSVPLFETRDALRHEMLVLKEHLHLLGQFPKAAAGSAGSLHIPTSPTELSRHHEPRGPKSPHPVGAPLPL